MAVELLDNWRQNVNVAMLSQLALADRVDYKLSAGKNRAAIARALANQLALILVMNPRLE